MLEDHVGARPRSGCIHCGERLVRRGDGRPHGHPRDRLAVAPVGIEFGDMEPVPAPVEPPAIGYLSRMSESLGLGTLVDAFIELKEAGTIPNLKLRVTGGQTAEDARFLERVQSALRRRNLQDDVEFIEQFDRASRHAFLRSLSVVSVPVPGGEAFGTFMIEALACGVPVVQPAEGAFPDHRKDRRGHPVRPERTHGLKNALETLLRDRTRAHELGRRGREAVLAQYSVEKTMENVLAVYKSLVTS